MVFLEAAFSSIFRMVSFESVNQAFNPVPIVHVETARVHLGCELGRSLFRLAKTSRQNKEQWAGSTLFCNVNYALSATNKDE